MSEEKTYGYEFGIGEWTWDKVNSRLQIDTIDFEGSHYPRIVFSNMKTHEDIRRILESVFEFGVEKKK